MRNGTRFLVTAALVAVMSITAAPAHAAAVWSFHGCSGPAETSSTFDALHEDSSGSAFRSIDDGTVFVGMWFEDLSAGVEFRPPGIGTSGKATVTCLVTNPFSGHELRISGAFAPDQG